MLLYYIYVTNLYRITTNNKIYVYKWVINAFTCLWSNPLLADHKWVSPFMTWAQIQINKNMGQVGLYKMDRGNLFTPT